MMNSLFRRCFRFLSLISVLFAVGVSPAFAVAPTAEEMQMKARWVGAKFDSEVLEQSEMVGIEVIANYEHVRRDIGLGGKIKIADTVYDRGLFTHAYSKLRVHLPSPGERFTAMVGIDNNQTFGHGTVKFFVKDDNGTVLFASELIRGNDKPVAVDVALSGSCEFFIEVSEAGDGIASDQAVWANAKATLRDGTELWLSDLPLADSPDRTYEGHLPFSFVYNGVPSSQFLSQWKPARTTTKLDENRTLRRLVFTEPNGGPLQVVCEVTEYLDFPTVEWVLYFKNVSADRDTGIIENVLPINTAFGVGTPSAGTPGPWGTFWGPRTKVEPNANSFLLHHSVGSPCLPIDYMPVETPINPDEKLRIATNGGRGTNSNMPYFNLQTGDAGWIIVLGWPGQWAAQFHRQGAGNIVVTAGQELTRFKLFPKETVRSPMAVVQAWKRGTWYDGQNLWRAWMIRHNVPRMPDGKLVDHHISGCSSHWTDEMVTADEASQIQFVDRYAEENIPIDYWWMDAGWYQCEGGGWPKTGTWEVDKKRFPNGLRAITDHARKQGVESIVWFEPERVAADTWITNQHPEWVIGGAAGGLLNLAIPEAHEWLTNHIDRLLKAEGIKFYRQDFNMDPLDHWRSVDAEDRKGITEMKHIKNYLGYWDALLERNPGLRIDSCASGGRRNDLETMRRSVPLWRTDFILGDYSNQAHTYGISLWIPYHGSGFRALDDYGMRSAFAPYGNYLYDVRTELDYETIRKNTKLWHEVIVPLYSADYYPLTQHSIENDLWIGWQWNDLEKGTGAIQMFRRPESIFRVGTFPLFGLETDASYHFTDVDSGKSFVRSGHELMTLGLDVEIDKAPKAIILKYEK